jgi:hypothetical protein
MHDSFLQPFLGVGLLALYLWIDIPGGYRRWACLALFILFPLVAGSPLRDLRLAALGVPTVGTALEARCVQGKTPYMLLTYRFNADGVSMTGTGRPGQGNGGCEMRAGDPVHVSYLPKEPVVNEAVRNPVLSLLQKLLGWMALSLFMTWLKSEQAARVKEHFNTFTFRRP